MAAENPTCSKDTRLEFVLQEVSEELGFPSLKVKQKEAIGVFVKGHDIFVSLPTGYGKSVIFAILPMVFDKLLG